MPLLRQRLGWVERQPHRISTAGIGRLASSSVLA